MFPKLSQIFAKQSSLCMSVQTFRSRLSTMRRVSNYLLFSLQAIAQQGAIWIIQQTHANSASRATTKMRSGEKVVLSVARRRRPNQPGRTKLLIADVSLSYAIKYNLNISLPRHLIVPCTRTRTTTQTNWSK